MKKLLFIPIAALFSACGGGSNECQFTKMITTTCNLNRGAEKLITNQDTLTGCFSITKTNTEATLADSKSDFRIKIKTNPNELDINDRGQQRVWKEERGYKIGNKMIGDTLILRYLPTGETPEEVLKFGIEYKLYK